MPKMHGAWAAKADGGSFQSVSAPEFHGAFREVLRPPDPLGVAESRAAAISFLRRDPHAQLPGAFQKAKVLRMFQCSQPNYGQIPSLIKAFWILVI